MRVPVTIVLDTDTDTLHIEVPAAAGAGDVSVLALDLKPLSADDKQRLRHVRPPEQDQRPPGTGTVGRPTG